MTKFALLLTAGLSLAGCADNPVATDPDALPNGIMQPVEGTGAVARGSFMPQIEHNSMPAQMK